MSLTNLMLQCKNRLASGLLMPQIAARLRHNRFTQQLGSLEAGQRRPAYDAKVGKTFLLGEMVKYMNKKTAIFGTLALAGTLIASVAMADTSKTSVAET